MAEFYLVRHGEPDWDWALKKNFYGPAGNYVPLTQKGVAQLEAAARDPRLKGADYILASPYTRTMQSAQILSRRLDLDVKVDWDIHEWIYDTGLKGDLPPEGDYHSGPDMVDCFDHYVVERGEPLPGRCCETIADIRRRVLPALRRHAAAKKVIVVCHEGVIRSLTDADPVEHGQIVPFTLPD